MSHPLSVGLGEVRLSRKGAEQLSIFGLGSCVAVFLYCPTCETVAAAHVVLPKSPESYRDDGNEPGRYADRAIPLLVSEMARAGVPRCQLRAAIVGGAAVLGFTSAIGDQNIQAVREELGRVGIPIEQEDVGGSRGRTVVFDAAARRLDVRVLAAPNTKI